MAIPPSAASSAPLPRGSRHPVRLDAGRIRFTAVWKGDRWGHLVTVDGFMVAESMEGTDRDRDPRWPPSPAIVALSRVESNRRPAVLGVGLAGRSHFSLSITSHPTLPDTLLFESACRILEAPAWLGSSYRTTAGKPILIPAPPPPAAPPATIQWAYAIGPRGIEPAG